MESHRLTHQIGHLTSEDDFRFKNNASGTFRLLHSFNSPILNFLRSMKNEISAGDHIKEIFVLTFFMDI